MTTDLVKAFDERLKTFSRTEQIELEGQMIVKYRFDKPEIAMVAQAAEIIENLLRANQFLCPTFHRETLATDLLRKPYLTIKGKIDRGMSVSICEVESEENDRYRDYFTDGPTIHPVRCSNNHLFERDLACIWREKKGDICPVGDHPIGSLVSTPAEERNFALHNRKLLGIIQERDLERDKRQLKELHERISNIVWPLVLYRTMPTCFSFGFRGTRILYRGGSFLLCELASGSEMVKAGARVMSVTLTKNAIEKTGKAVLKEVAEEASEIALKKTTEQVSKVVVKEAAEEVGEAVAKKAVEKLGKETGKRVSKKAVETFGKIVPVAGVAWGCGCMFWRFYHGQIVKGLGELASGVAGCFPGYGTVISLGIDTVLLGTDIAETVSSVRAPPDALTSSIIIQLNPQSAYRILGIAPSEAGLRDRKAIDDVFARFHKLIESDLSGPAAHVVDEQLEMTKGVCTSALDHAKEVIYQSRSWV